MSIDAVKKAQELIREPDRIASVQWSAVAEDPHKGQNRWYGNPEAADEQLQWAIEEFRKRKIDAIDAQLRDLGVDLRHRYMASRAPGAERFPVSPSAFPSVRPPLATVCRVRRGLC